MKKKKKKGKPRARPLPPAVRPARSHRASWGCLSLSALRPSGRARAHSPGLIYFFKGGSFILVGLGGKEDWGFCTVSTTRPVHFPPFFFLLLLFPQPSFSSQALQSPPQACCVSLSPPSFPTSPFCVCLVSPFLSSLWVSRVGGRRAGGWAERPSGGGAGMAPRAMAPPTRRRRLPGSAQGRGSGLGRPVLLCAAGRRALMGKLLEEQGGGRVGGERQMQIYIEDN